MKATRITMTKSIFGVLLMAAMAGSSYAAWPTAHGDRDNRGFARVDTLAAATQIGFANVGQVAPGANPVTAADGTVYIGNLAGEFIALFPNGSPYWKRTLDPNFGVFFSSPVVGGDGAVYAVSTYSYLDHRGGTTTRVYTSFLHRFLPGGGWNWAPFPKHGLDGGATTAPPNIWTWNGTEIIMEPVLYRSPYGTEVHVVAFSTAGTVVADKLVTFQSYQVTQDNSIWDYLPCLPCGFSATPSSTIDAKIWPQPGVAIWEDPQGAPWVWVADNIRSTVAYKFDTATGFSEISRFSDTNNRLSSPPTALDNGIAAVGTKDGLVKFERDNFSIAGFGPITAAPTRMNDGRLVVINRGGAMSVINSHSVVLQQQLNGESIASAAASCTHLFVSTTNEFVTFDVKTMLPLARLSLTGGGFNPPIIGPFGHVYAMTNVGLFVFAAPKRSPLQTTFSTACNPPISTGGVVVR